MSYVSVEHFLIGLRCGPPVGESGRERERERERERPPIRGKAGIEPRRKIDDSRYIEVKAKAL